MRAGYLIAPRAIEVRDEPVPLPPEGGMVVRVRVALTDGTDLKAFRRGHPQMPMPTRFGHEFSGDVAALGSGVDAFEVGDAVACVHSAPCGSCFWCSHEQEELCEHVMETKILGAYAEYLAVPSHIVARNAFRKPATMAYEVAAFLEPLSCVVHSLSLLAPAAGSKLLVIGDGAFGILHALVARVRHGCETILVGRHDERLEVARAVAAGHVVDARHEDVLQTVRALTAERGADAAVECTGTAEVWEAAPRYVRRGGTVVLFGGLPSGTHVPYDSYRLHYDEVRLLSPFHFTPAAVRTAYDLLASELLPVQSLISATYPLDALPRAFADLEAKSGLKYAIVP
jgi:L-iditol 2-dehydrogenase